MSNKEIKGSVVASSGTKQGDYWVGSLEKVLLGESWGSIPHPFVSHTTRCCGSKTDNFLDKNPMLPGVRFNQKNDTEKIGKV